MRPKSPTTSSRMWPKTWSMFEFCRAFTSGSPTRKRAARGGAWPTTRSRTSCSRSIGRVAAEDATRSVGRHSPPELVEKVLHDDDLVARCRAGGRVFFHHQKPVAIHVIWPVTAGGETVAAGAQSARPSPAGGRSVRDRDGVDGHAAFGRCDVVQLGAIVRPGWPLATVMRDLELARVQVRKRSTVDFQPSCPVRRIGEPSPVAGDDGIVLA